MAILLTGPGPYPISMINLPGQRLANAAPPSVALLAVATAQLGLILLLRQRTERWLHRDRPWQAVIAVNSVVLTVFLWHLSAAVLLVGALHGLGLLPTPEAGTAAWLAWRLPWVLMLAVVLAVLVAIFGPIDGVTGRPGSCGRRRVGGAAPLSPSPHSPPSSTPWRQRRGGQDRAGAARVAGGGAGGLPGRRGHAAPAQVRVGSRD